MIKLSFNANYNNWIVYDQNNTNIGVINMLEDGSFIPVPNGRFVTKPNSSVKIQLNFPTLDAAKDAFEILGRADFLCYSIISKILGRENYLSFLDKILSPEELKFLSFLKAV